MNITTAHTAQIQKMTPGTVSLQEHNRGVTLNEPVIVMMDAFHRYALAHEKRFESKLSEDYILGPAWLSGIKGVRTLLNGEGQFDGGTLEGLFWAAMEVAGFSEEDI